MLKEWLRRLFGGRRESGDASPPAPRTSKTFIVHDPSAGPPAAPGPSAPLTRRPSPPPPAAAPEPRAGQAGGGRFVVASATRPKICPQCRTKGKVTRASDTRFECKECGHLWS